MTFILSKNEFWSLNNGGVKAMARMNLAIAGLAGSSYRMEENIAKGEVNGTFSLSGNTLQSTSWDTLFVGMMNRTARDPAFRRQPLADYHARMVEAAELLVARNGKEMAMCPSIVPRKGG